MDETQRVDAPRTLSDYVAVFRRRWLILVFGVLFGLVGGLAFGVMQPTVYESSTKVIVNQTGVPETSQPVGGRNVSGINLDTQAQLVQSEVVAEGAKELLESQAPAEGLRSRVSVKVAPNTPVMTITFRAGTPPKARAGSHAFAQAYLNERAAQAKRELDAQIQALEKQKATLEGQLAALSAKVADLRPGSAEREKAEASQSILANQITTVSTRLIPLQTAQITPGSIISDAKLPSRPTSPNMFLLVASGTFAGLLLGLALALLADRLDRRLHSVSQVRRQTDLPVLAEVRHGQLPLAVADRSSHDARTFTQLRNALFAALARPVQAGRGRSNVLLAVGAAPGVAPGVVVANLCATLSRSGHRVILLCADPESPSPALLGVDGGLGLADVLRGEVGIGDVQQLSPICPDVRVVTPGTDATAEDYVPEWLGGVVYALAAYSGYLVIETRPARTSADGQALASLARVSFGIVELRRTTRDDLDEVVGQFEQVGTPLTGLVVVPYTNRRPSALSVRPGPANVHDPLPAPRKKAATARIAVPPAAARQEARAEPRPDSRAAAKARARRIPTPRS